MARGFCSSIGKGFICAFVAANSAELRLGAFAETGAWHDKTGDAFDPLADVRGFGGGPLLSRQQHLLCFKVKAGAALGHTRAIVN